jgi:hypothetical protein
MEMHGQQNIKFCLSLDEPETVKHYINHTEYVSEVDIHQAHAAAAADRLWSNFNAELCESH